MNKTRLLLSVFFTVMSFLACKDHSRGHAPISPLSATPTILKIIGNDFGTKSLSAGQAAIISIKVENPAGGALATSLNLEGLIIPELRFMSDSTCPASELKAENHCIFEILVKPQDLSTSFKKKLVLKYVSAGQQRKEFFLLTGQFQYKTSFFPDWLNNTRFVDNNKCLPAPTLYRGFHSNFFDIKRVMRNMLNDETAEIPSWRVTKMLNTKFPPGSLPPSASQWENIKEEAAKLLQVEAKNYSPICELAEISSDATLVTDARNLSNDDQAPKWKSFGIASGDYSTATTFARGLFLPVPHVRHSVVLEIKEKVPRAALRLGDPAGYQEYYFPIVIPAADISGAWTGSLANENHGHFLEKIEATSPEIHIHKTSKLYEGFPLDANGSNKKIEGRIIACSGAQNCVSDPIPPGDEGLKYIVSSIPREKIKGRYFKFIKEPIWDSKPGL